ncbi:hypothetical protein CIY_33920 [Butyrivibrio fibrisolvens 16/4]|nr:hypothetical protein CIY_33920 [Butyrivibrio fibrisolvens 16/4]
MELKNAIIAVDFDNTLCFSNWPELGEPNLPLIQYLKQQKSLGNKLILWTCRAGKPLEDATRWCLEHGLILMQLMIIFQKSSSFMVTIAERLHATSTSMTET